jgi:cytochrome oxidase assembly protein ShyY1
MSASLEQWQHYLPLLRPTLEVLAAIFEQAPMLGTWQVNHRVEALQIIAELRTQWELGQISSEQLKRLSGLLELSNSQQTTVARVHLNAINEWMSELNNKLSKV